MSRYRAGKVPQFKRDEVDIDPVKRPNRDDTSSSNGHTDRSGPVDRRLLRATNVNREDAINERRSRHQHQVAEVLAEGVEDDDEGGDMDISTDDKPTTETTSAGETSSDVTMNDDDDENDKRRERLKRKMLEREEKPAPQVAVKLQQQDDDESGSEEESESDEDSEEEMGARKHIAPVFKRKEERDTINAQIKLEEEEEAKETERQRRKEELAAESREMLKMELERKEDEVMADANSADVEEEEEDDESNAEEYERWKLRELARIKKERQDRENVEKEKLDIERRRRMTDREISVEDADRLEPKEKAKWNYMQKYYHKGAYFRTFDENDKISNKWDFNQPTLEDKMDKTMLPAVMQVKNFGRASRTKYTHLKDQDTSNFDSPWYDKKNPLMDKYKSKLAGTGSVSRKK